MSSLRTRLLAAAALLQLASAAAAAGLTTTPSLPVPLPLPPRSQDSGPSCKAVPGTPAWPSPDVWARLNESLAGGLLQPPPPGAVCHPGQATYDGAACPAVQAAWSTYEFHSASPVSVDWNQWANDTCLPQPAAPCSGRGYPVFVVNATRPRHVQLGVQFGLNPPSRSPIYIPIPVPPTNTRPTQPAKTTSASSSRAAGTTTSAAPTPPTPSPSGPTTCAASRRTPPPSARPAAAAPSRGPPSPSARACRCGICTPPSTR